MTASSSHAAPLAAGPGLPGHLARGDILHAFCLAGPATFFLFALLLGPVVGVVIMSLTNWQLGAKSFDFVGLANYHELFGDTVFWISLGNTLIYVGVVVPTAIAIALSVAILIESNESLKRFYRTAYFLPVTGTVVAMAVAWEFILHQNFGFLNTVLHALGFEGENWLNDESTVLMTLAVIGIWLKVGYYMVIFLAGLNSIPSDLYEAAELDGADSAWDRFTRVTWPMLGPAMLFVLVIATIQSLQVFETVAVLTRGGPSRASDVLLYTLYKEGFVFFRVGYASALTVIFLAFILVITIINVRWMDKRIHYA